MFKQTCPEGPSIFKNLENQNIKNLRSKQLAGPCMNEILDSSQVENQNIRNLRSKQLANA